MLKKRRIEKKYDSKESDFLVNFVGFFMIITTPKSTEITYLNWKIRKIILVNQDSQTKTILIKKTKYKDIEQKLELDNKNTTAYFYSRPGTRSKGKFVPEFIFTHKQP